MMWGGEVPCPGHACVLFMYMIWCVCPRRVSCVQGTHVEMKGQLCGVSFFFYLCVCSGAQTEAIMLVCKSCFTQWATSRPWSIFKYQYYLSRSQHWYHPSNNLFWYYFLEVDLFMSLFVLWFCIVSWIFSVLIRRTWVLLNSMETVDSFTVLSGSTCTWFEASLPDQFLSMWLQCQLYFLWHWTSSEWT